MGSPLQPHVPAPATLLRTRGLRLRASRLQPCLVCPRSNLLRPAAEQPATATGSVVRASKYKWLLRPAGRGEVGVAVGIVMDGPAPPPPPPLARDSACARTSSNPRRACSLVRRGQKYEERLSRARNSTAAASQRRSIEGKRRESDAAAAGCRRAQQQVYAAGGFRTTVCLGAHVMCTAARMHVYCSLGACDCSLNACMGVAWAYRPATLGVPPCNPRRQKW